MSLIAVRPGLPLARVNPVAKLAAMVPLAGCLVLTLDPVSAGVAALCSFVLFLAVGLGPLAFSARTAAVWIGAPLGGISMVLYGRPSGRSYFEFAVVHITDGSIMIGASTALRILALAWPAVVLFLTIDPTDLADGLGQTLRLPSRFVLGALAALRLIGATMEDWRALGLARRARGIGDGGALVRFVRQAFAVLVLSIRRGGVLATAMEARAFGAPVRRSWARPARFGAPELAVIAAGAAVAAVSVSAAVLTGSWNVIGSG